ncbi:hypothetical protein [Azospirillum sp. sgz302134]
MDVTIHTLDEDGNVVASETATCLPLTRPGQLETMLDLMGKGASFEDAWHLSEQAIAMPGAPT